LSILKNRKDGVPMAASRESNETLQAGVNDVPWASLQSVR
jgi:hypothetical protein